MAKDDSTRVSDTKSSSNVAARPASSMGVQTSALSSSDAACSSEMELARVEEFASGALVSG